MYSKETEIITTERAQYRNWCNSQQFTLLTNDKQPHRSFPLPPELLIEILGYLNNCQATLYAASLVCKQWLYCTAPILYCNPQIKDTYHWAAFILTLTRERMSFFYGDLIRSIDLSSGKSIEAMKDQEFYRRLSDTNENQQPPPQSPPSSNATNILTYPILTIESIEHFARPTVRPRAQNFTRPSNRREQQEQEYLIKGLPFIIVSTSSLIQLSHTCKNITTLNLSYTSLLYDSQVAETGEYLSTLQRYAAQRGLTHIQIPIEDAIEAIGAQCMQLQEVKIQRCEWVTAHVIWMFVYYCPRLKRLDARRSTKCTVKRLIASLLEVPDAGCLLSNGSYHPTTAVSEMNVREYQHSLNQRRFHHEVIVQDELVEQNALESSDERATIHFRFNEETGLYEQVELPNNTLSRYDLAQQIAESDERATTHFRFNEDTGLYEQVELPNNTLSRYDLAQQIAEEEALSIHHLNTYWLTSSSDDSVVGQRPPSPIHQQILDNSNGAANKNKKTLKDMVHDIIVDAKDLGAADLNWFQDYH